ncbi:OsmC family protein [Aerococcus sp. UMB7834]|uniref:OsmC family protein n=1 Tax=Aerococcus sp. UMB7834 TaxID=3046342 RepID=UPI00255035F9|nr:OsmC family protein [Aerococcus sp. UMB7834]MDK6804671.1 OsmC family protein [Aerococcus sp. UMB7834]
MMNRRVDEASVFELSMRGTCPDLKEVKLYTDRKALEAEQVVSFDNEFEGFSSVSYFLSSLLSSVILTTIRELKEEGIELDEIEGLVHAQLTNPLRLIPVRGYQEPSDLTAITIKLFYYADGDPAIINQKIRQAQAYNPIYRLVDKASPIHLEVEWVL